MPIGKVFTLQHGGQHRGTGSFTRTARPKEASLQGQTHRHSPPSPPQPVTYQANLGMLLTPLGGPG